MKKPKIFANSSATTKKMKDQSADHTLALDPRRTAFGRAMVAQNLPQAGGGNQTCEATQKVSRRLGWVVHPNLLPERKTKVHYIVWCNQLIINML